MKKIAIGDLRQEIAEVVNESVYRSERSIITRHSKPVAAIVPMEDLELLNALEDAILLDEAKAALADYNKNGGVDWEKLKKEVGLK